MYKRRGRYIEYNMKELGIQYRRGKDRLRNGESIG